MGILGGLFHWFLVALLRYHQNPLSLSCGSPSCLELTASLLIGPQATAAFGQPEAPTHLPQVLQEAWPLGFQKADCHPAFLSCRSLETMENTELLPSSARQQWCPATPSISWHSVGRSKPSLPRLTCASGWESWPLSVAHSDLVAAAVPCALCDASVGAKHSEIPT